jgi:hypothetical protein
MNTGNGLVRELFDAALTLLIAALLLRWAYRLVRPIAPILVAAAVGALVIKWLRHRDERW